jgi:UDP-3-O-[3-hydroxymyristoyl] glucosamine N-acyltransferase
VLHPGAVIGADGFGFAPNAGTWLKIPQLGSVAIGDDVEIGANTTVDRGAIDATPSSRNGVKLDNPRPDRSQRPRGRAHGDGRDVGRCGSTKIGKRCMIGGGVVMINQIEICDDVMFTFRSIVTKSIDKPGTYSGGLPADEAGKWRRNAARFRKLDALAERVIDTERTLAALTGKERKKDDD